MDSSYGGDHLFLASDDSMPPGIEIDDYDSEGDIHFLEELLSNDSPPLPENESFSLDHFDDPTFPRPHSGTTDVEICFILNPAATLLQQSGRFPKIMKTRASFSISNHPVTRIETGMQITYEVKLNMIIREVRVAGVRVSSNEVRRVNGTGPIIRTHEEAVGGVQKDYNTLRSSNMSGGVLERTKLPFHLEAIYGVRSSCLKGRI
ncbi:hypothetical protein Tco_1093095 [Tanacetum coccineum]|uniref:Uncharacterized protein n=1 Tax=Tanacetum coccineum TaxID=301880 RepID=A0ABQ5IBP8_9ASTR